jgi:multidrug efflux pump subunit AcrB
VVEIPPGPPVLSTMVSEVFGPDMEGQLKIAKQIRELYSETPGIVDIDWMVDHPQDKMVIRVDRRAASLRRLPVKTVHDGGANGGGGTQTGLLYGQSGREQIPIVIRLPETDRKDLDTVMNMKVPADDGSFITIKDVAKVANASEDISITHKNLQRVIYVIGDLAGREESPVYALQKLSDKIREIKAPEGYSIDIRSTSQPDTTDRYSMKWDGEWQITYEVFRDLGMPLPCVILIYV